MKRTKLTRRRKIVLSKQAGPDWKRKLQGQKLAKALERIELEMEKGDA